MVLVQPEFHLDDHHHGHVLALEPAWAEEPLLGGLDGFFIETERAVQRLEDADFRDDAVRAHHRLEFNDALNFGAHGVGRVLRIDLLENRRIRHTVAGAHRIATEPAACAATDAGTFAGSHTSTRAWAGCGRSRESGEGSRYWNGGGHLHGRHQ